MLNASSASHHCPPFTVRHQQGRILTDMNDIALEDHVVLQMV